jgi:hypothetical protein
MPMEETLKNVAQDIARVSIDDAGIKGHASGLAALVAEIDRLRALPLKDCEPSLVFLPTEE